jgi:hypothetical protein
MANGTYETARRVRSIVVVTAILAGATWSEAARATPEFPAIVVKTLGLSEITVDPPQGCTLCHSTDSGGTALRPFGTLVQQDGVQPYEDATLEQALAQIEQSQPALVADIRAGRDPNDDDSASAPPTPQYGCSVGRAGASGRSPAQTAFLPFAWVLLASLRSARARRRIGRRANQKRA